MSAIEETEENALGVYRYHTRCKVVVHSHTSGRVELGDDVASIQMSKNLKGPGQASLTLTPSRNWLNILCPNDYINIYLDIGDGQGWTRTFFGFIDRVEESFEIDIEGIPKTSYFLVCTDFYKAFDLTQIYFNPHLASRPDFAGDDIAAPNIGGLALQSRGIRAAGSPSDIVQNFILATLGFGSQFILPAAYTPNMLQGLRKRRAEYVQGQLSTFAQEAIKAAGGSYEQLKEKVKREALGLSASLSGTQDNQKDAITAVAKELDIEASVVEQLVADGDQAKLLGLFNNTLLEKQVQPSQEALARTGVGGSQGLINALEGTISKNASLLDVVDTFTFMERKAIDGYQAGAAVWQQQGSLLSLMRSMSNEAVNELFLDLRPLSVDQAGTGTSEEPTTGSYARIPDDIGENIGGAIPGITYAPAVVMREYPFSTIQGLDLSDVEISLISDNGTESIGALHFGAIFSDNPNVPGRHIVSMPNINLADKAEGRATAKATKHLDVAVVSEQEIMATHLGRSDSEHFNLFEFFDGGSVLGNDARYYMNDLLPIITPIHVMQHGLRVRTVTTRFTRFSLAASHKVSNPEDLEAEDEANSSEEEQADNTEQPATTLDLGPPAYAADGAHFRNRGYARWGYRNINDDEWTFHQGIDIVTTEDDVPARAIADGEVVISAPDGVFGGYGNVVVIRHKFDGIGTYYSVYAHLASRSVGWGLDKQVDTRDQRPLYAVRGAPAVQRGSHEPNSVPVKKGDVIGIIGATHLPQTGFMGVHLHFEIDKNFVPKSDATPAIPYSVFPRGVERQDPRPDFPAGFVPSGINMPSQQRSCDPVAFFASAGYDLEALISGTASDQDVDDATTGETLDAGTEDPDANPAKQDALEEAGRAPLPEEPTRISSGAVDSASSRVQMIRWALLQDHWYQHNLEYLSGRIDMRGAPEIRVGYRLDIKERGLSFYVEGVNHTWQFPDKMTTSLQVTRGQPNNPYPVYVLPATQAFKPGDGQRRSIASRLAKYFVTPDPIAIRRSLVLRKGSISGAESLATAGNTVDVLLDSTVELVVPSPSYQSAIDAQVDALIDTEGRVAQALSEQEVNETAVEDLLNSIAGPDGDVKI